ncbi:MAG: murein biosynthesis integral membrane protein MurJ [Candidatus Omnitrophota bacterium]
MSNKRLIKSTSGVSLATSVSRILGFIRDVLIANFFGTNVFAEAFVVAFRVPNLLRDLVGEGAANAAFVPVLTEYHTRRSEKEFWNLARELLSIVAIILFGITVIGIFSAPIIVRLIAPGFIDDPSKLAITVKLTRVMFPFIFLVGMTAYGMGVLNSLHHFSVPALGPVFLNIAMILALLYVCPRVGVIGLALAVLVGGVLQVVSLGFVLHKKGLRLAPTAIAASKNRERGYAHPAIKRIWKLLIPRIFGSAVYQISVIVDNIFSTFAWIVGAGGPAALWYAYRLFHLPLAIFGIALATVALPKMSMEVAKRDINALKETINFSLRAVFLLLIPATVGLAILGNPIIRILFERGEFTSYSTYITSSALFFYSIGLFACGGIKILVNSFFSLGDTRTPVKVASISLVINLVLNASLMWSLKIGGLALATSIAAISNFAMLYILLVKKIGDIDTKRILGSFGRVATASIFMGAFAYVSGTFLEGLNYGIVFNIGAILAVILLSIVIYTLLGVILGIDEIKDFFGWIFKRR